MLSTKNIVISPADVPPSWIFEFYLKLPVKITNEQIRIKSVFNSKDSNPSFYIYRSKTTGKLRFKDHSTSREGDAVELVQQLYNLNSRFEAGLQIISDYQEYLKNNPNAVSDFSGGFLEYKVVGFDRRPWNSLDFEYWREYSIPFSRLEEYKVFPLAYIIISRDKINRRIIKRDHMYGFFKNNGQLYKIYRPKDEHKFFEVRDWIHGWEQLTFKKPYLLIGSSMKDILAFKSLNISNVEVLAPKSENTMISRKLILGLQERYKAIVTLFDPDPTGIMSMDKYEEEYGISKVVMNIEKDLARAIKIHKPRNIAELLIPMLVKAFTKNTRS